MPHFTTSNRQFVLILCCLMFFPALFLGQRVDTTFGDDGFVFSDYRSTKSSYSRGIIRALSDGHYMMAGYQTSPRVSKDVDLDPPRQVWFNKLQADGSPDSTFGENGLKIHTLSRDVYAISNYFYSESGNYFYIVWDDNESFFIHVFDQDGNPDLSYGQNGIVPIPALGVPGTRMSSIRCHGLSNGDMLVSFVLQEIRVSWLKLKKDGTRDTNFGNGGIHSIPNSTVISMNTVEVFGDSVIISTSANSVRGQLNSWLYVQTMDGVPDSSFNQTGKRLCPFGRDVYRFPDGRTTMLSDEEINMYDPSGVIIARKVFNTFPHIPNKSYFERLSIDTTNRWVLSGRSEHHHVCTRLHENFDIDTTFGTHGFLRFQPEGNLILVYTSLNRQQAITKDQGLALLSEFGISKLDTTGNLDVTFGNQGFLTLHRPSSGSTWEKVHQDSEGYLWAAGINNYKDLLAGNFDEQGVNLPIENHQKLIVIPGDKDQDRFNPDALTKMMPTPDDGFLLMGTDSIEGVVRKFTKAGKPDPLFTEIRAYEQVSEGTVFPSGNFLAVAMELPTEADVSRDPFPHIHKYDEHGNQFNASDFQFHIGLQNTSINWRKFVIRGIVQLANEGFVFVGQQEGRTGFYVRKSLPNGSPDSSFGNYGWSSIPASWSSYVDVDFFHQTNDGKLLVGSRKGVARLLANGSLDTRFYNNGWIDFDFDWSHLGYSRVDRYTTNMAILPDNSYMHYGMIRFNRGDIPQMYLTHFHTNGQRNMSFGDKGYFILDHTAHTDVPFDLLVQSDTSLILAGFSNEHACMVRIISDQFIGPTTSNDDLLELGHQAVSTVYPNPTSSRELYLQYQLRAPQSVEIQLYSSTGKFIETLFSEVQPTGSQTIQLSLPSSISQGVYLLKLRKDSETSWHKLILN